MACWCEKGQAEKAIFDQAKEKAKQNERNTAIIKSEKGYEIVWADEAQGKVECYVTYID